MVAFVLSNTPHMASFLNKAVYTTVSVTYGGQGQWCSFDSFLAKSSTAWQRPTDQQRDGPTDWPTDQWTDRVTYRVACTRLKIAQTFVTYPPRQTQVPSWPQVPSWRQTPPQSRSLHRSPRQPLKQRQWSGAIHSPLGPQGKAQMADI